MVKMTSIRTNGQTDRQTDVQTVGRMDGIRNERTNKTAFTRTKRQTRTKTVSYDTKLAFCKEEEQEQEEAQVQHFKNLLSQLRCDAG